MANKINIGDSWEDLDSIQINIGDAWKDVVEAYINIGDAWKKFYPGAFKFEVITTAADTFQLPIYNGGTYDFHVVWGDGNTSDITAYNDAAANHSYVGAGTYNVEITGTLVGWRFNAAGDRTLIHDISQWGILDVGELGHNFFGCSNLTISATDGLNCPDKTDFRSCFSNCHNLTALPSGVFDKCTAALTFLSCFSYCEDLITLPSDLFDKCTLVTDFTGCFSSCNSVVIPSGLFDKNIEVTTFRTCFYQCDNLASLPAGLFDKNIEVTTFRQCFYQCDNLASLPADLIKYNTKIDTCEYMFSGDSNMTGDGTAFCDQATAHGVSTTSFCFYNCTSLPDYDLIPAGYKYL